MADCKTTETHGLALVPLRNGKLLTNNNASRAQTPGKSTNRATGTTNSRALIPLWHRKETSTNPNRQEHPTNSISLSVVPSCYHVSMRLMDVIPIYSTNCRTIVYFLSLHRRAAPRISQCYVQKSHSQFGTATLRLVTIESLLHCFSLGMT